MRTLFALMVSILCACGGTTHPAPQEAETKEPKGSEAPRYCNASWDGKLRQCYDQESKAKASWQEKPRPDVLWACQRCGCALIQHHQRIPEYQIEPPALPECDQVTDEGWRVQ